MNATGYAQAVNRASVILDHGPAGANRSTEADRLASRMSGAVVALSGMVGRLSRAVDRINGPAPQGSPDKTESPLPAGHVGAMDHGFNDLEVLLGRFRDELERLEGFA